MNAVRNIAKRKTFRIAIVGLIAAVVLVLVFDATTSRSCGCEGPPFELPSPIATRP